MKKRGLHHIVVFLALQSIAVAQAFGPQVSGENSSSKNVSSEKTSSQNDSIQQAIAPVSVILKVRDPAQTMQHRRLRPGGLAANARRARVFDRILAELPPSMGDAATLKNGRPATARLRVRRHSKFSDASLMSLRVTQAEFQRLKQNPDVEVHLNRWHKVALAQSVPLVFSDQLTSSFTGLNQSVVLLDTGVDASHSFLAGRVDQSAAACFSNDNNGGGGPPGGESLCPDGPDGDTDPDGSFIGAGAASHCDANILDCDHGTQMAGIIAGSSMSFNGMTIGANVIPVQVFTKVNDEGVCGDISVTPCIGALTSDIIRALEYITTIVNSKNVASVAVSFGSSAGFQGQCDANPEKAVIDQLSSQRVGVVASSGNGSSAVEMTSPACISSAISVASTDIADEASNFNNRNSELDFFAPGENITTSTLPANSFGDAGPIPEGGTSAAAAHVAAAWAILKSKNSTASVSEVKQALSSTGISVTQGLVTKPRINVTAALASLDLPTPNDDGLCVPINAANGKVVLVCV